MQCLTVSSKNWLRKEARFLSGKERLLMQGFDVDAWKDAVASTPESTLWALAGNSVNFYNMAVGFICGMAVLGSNFAPAE